VRDWGNLLLPRRPDLDDHDLGFLFELGFVLGYQVIGDANLKLPALQAAETLASGVLAALLKGHGLQTALEWGAAHGILVQETPGDTTMIDEKLVLSEVKWVHSRVRSGKRSDLALSHG